jgi:hypothetical protein
MFSGTTELEMITDAVNEGGVYKFLTKQLDDELLRKNIAEAFLHYELMSENERST